MLIELNFGLFCAVLTVLCSMWILGRFLLSDEYVYIPEKKRHNWKSIKLLNRASYCSICKMMLSSSTNGQFCDCCGVCADPSCIKKVDEKMKCKDKVKTTTTRNSLSEVLPNFHLWVKGNLPINTICFVCGEDVDYHAEPGLYGYRCCWCQRCAHTECFKSKSLDDDKNKDQICDFGAFKCMIIPPTSLMVNKSSGVRKLKLTEIVPPKQQIDNWKPLFVIANAKSGDSKSSEVVSLFRGILHPQQVTEINYKGPKEALRWVAKCSPVQCRVLVAGGDGTIGWILNTIFEMNIQPIPEVCILPIGTGNDLSRVLGWGSEPPNSLLPNEILQKIQNAKSIKLDRWNIDIHNATNRMHLKWSPNRSLFMYNYFSIGVDAQVALNFHRARQSPFYVFGSRMINKALYLCFGTQQVVQPDCVGLEKQIELYLDDKQIELPELQSIVCLNIDSWGAGVRLWEMSTTEENEQMAHSTSDGILEVLGIVSSFHIAQLQVGLNQPIRIGQARSIKIIIKENCPVQADGEPWIQSCGEVSITCQGQANMLKANG